MEWTESEKYQGRGLFGSHTSTLTHGNPKTKVLDIFGESKSNGAGIKIRKGQYFGLFKGFTVLVDYQ